MKLLVRSFLLGTPGLPARRHAGPARAAGRSARPTGSACGSAARGGDRRVATASPSPGRPARSRREPRCVAVGSPGRRGASPAARRRAPSGLVTWWFAADEAPYAEPLLTVDGRRAGPVQHAAVVSHGRADLRARRATPRRGHLPARPSRRRRRGGGPSPRRRAVGDRDRTAGRCSPATTSRTRCRSSRRRCAPRLPRGSATASTLRATTATPPRSRVRSCPASAWRARCCVTSAVSSSQAGVPSRRIGRCSTPSSSNSGPVTSKPKVAYQPASPVCASSTTGRSPVSSMATRISSSA